MAVAENKTQKYRNGLSNFYMYTNVFIIYDLSSAVARCLKPSPANNRLAVLHSSSTTGFKRLATAILKSN